MRRTIIGSLIVLATVCVPNARGGLYQDIYHGMGIIATPSGFPITTTADGTQIYGERRGRVRILPDKIGQGYTLEFDRSYGLDPRGQPEVLDLGPYELELRGSTAMTLGFTRRGMLIGNANVAANNLAYVVRSKTGAQDLELRGQLNVGSSMEINELGFYTLTMNVSNANSTLTADGVLVEASDITNFDVGPIDVTGNIYIDGLAALMAGFGMDTSALDPFISDSPIDVITGAIREDMERAGLVAGLQVYDDSQFPPASAGLGLDEVLGSATDSAQLAPGDGDGHGVLPEPGTLVLLSLGGAALCIWRRR